MNGVTFGDKHSWRNWHCVLTSWDIPLPDVNEDRITVPGMDGSLDQTEYLSGITYKDRPPLKFHLTFIGPATSYHQKRQEIAEYLHGKICRIIMDTDPDYYYEGRCSVDNFRAGKGIATFEIRCEGVVWKLRRTTTKVTKALTSAYQNIVLHNERRRVVPTITVQYATTIRMNGKTIDLAAGTHRILDFQLGEGMNIMEARLKNTSTGTITVEYQEASL